MFCTKCGAKNDDNASFCCSCGNALNSNASGNNKAAKPFGFGALKSLAKANNIDINAVKEKASIAGDMIVGKAADVKDAATVIAEDVNEKLTELDRMLAQEITVYNDSYTRMSDKGVQLFIERSRAVDTVDFVETLVNSIANRPKSFENEFKKIDTERAKFTDSCDFAERELHDARSASSAAGAGLAAGASVAFLGPTAAMWVATTFGTASTGAAISTLSGAAATNAAMAWLGGGAVVAGGQGIAGGSALLGLAGPVGWTIAGASILSTIVVFSAKKAKTNKMKNEEIERVKNNTEKVKEMDAKITELLSETIKIREGLNEALKHCLQYYGSNFQELTAQQQDEMGSLINQTLTMAEYFGKTIE